jgi:hypothetical protein
MLLNLSRGCAASPPLCYRNSAGSGKMAKGNFGERMKRERELREVSLAEVTRGTRISQQFLEALENEQWD